MRGDDEPLRKRTNSPQGAVAATGGTAVGLNVVAGDQYLALVLTGNVYKEEFRNRGIAPPMPSGQIEQTQRHLSARPVEFLRRLRLRGPERHHPRLPVVRVFNWINPLISFIYAAFGIAIQKSEPGDESPPLTEASFYGVAGQDAKEVPEDGSRR